jgi:peptidoglycan hydrolase-like protein with peptidoglycan-binding domain
VLLSALDSLEAKASGCRTLEPMAARWLFERACSRDVDLTSVRHFMAEIGFIDDIRRVRDDDLREKVRVQIDCGELVGVSLDSESRPKPVAAESRRLADDIDFALGGRHLWLGGGAYALILGADLARRRDRKSFVALPYPDASRLLSAKPSQGFDTLRTLLDRARELLARNERAPEPDRFVLLRRALRVALPAPVGETALTPSQLRKVEKTRPPIWRVRMVGMIFDADKCFLLPQALHGIRSVVAMHQAHPAAEVLIVGHEGGDELSGSVTLALSRAKILSGYLTSKPGDWMPWFEPGKSQRQRWGVREVQLMLSALTGADGKPFYDGGSAGVMDAKTATGLKAFQLANGLAADGKPGAGTRKALVTKYMALEDTSLAAGVEPVTHGCTGHEDDTITKDGLQPDDRRLEVLFFDTAIDPPPSGDTSSAGSAEYPAWRKRLVQTVDFENHGIHVQLVDTQKRPVPLATVHLEGPAPQDTVADEHGFVTFWGLVAGEYTVHATTRTGIPVPATKITYPTAKTIEGARLPPGKGTEGSGASSSPASPGGGAS